VKNLLAADVDSNGTELAEYEIKRLEKIENNKELLIRLQIDAARKLVYIRQIRSK
jgi:hypothetical protein